MYIVYILLACVASVLYRAGGMSKEPNAKPKWIPIWMRHSKVRDIGCSLIVVGLSILLFGINKNWWAYLVAFGLSWASLTTYWDELPFNNGKDNFWMAGFFVGLSLFSLAFIGIIWYNVLVRSILLGLLWGGVNWLVNKKQIKDSDLIEEFSRGAFMVITIPILLL